MSLHMPDLFTMIGVYTEDGRFAGNVLVPYHLQDGDTYIPASFKPERDYNVEAFAMRRSLLPDARAIQETERG